MNTSKAMGQCRRPRKGKCIKPFRPYQCTLMYSRLILYYHGNCLPLITFTRMGRSTRGARSCVTCSRLSCGSSIPPALVWIWLLITVCMYVYVHVSLGLLYTLPFDPHVCSVYTSHKAMKTALNNYVCIYGHHYQYMQYKWTLHGVWDVMFSCDSHCCHGRT